MKDIFDQVEEEMKEEAMLSNLERGLSSLLGKYADKERKTQDQKITDDVTNLVKAEIQKIKPTQKVIERTVHVPVPQPPQKIKEIVREIVVREVAKEEKKDDRKYVEEKTVESLKKEVQLLKAKLDEVNNALMFSSMGGSGVIGIPPPEGNPDNYVLTISKGKAQWKVATGGSGGSSSDVYTPSNVSTDRSYDATNTSLDEIANVLGSLIASLQGAGIIQ